MLVNDLTSRFKLFQSRKRDSDISDVAVIVVPAVYLKGFSPASGIQILATPETFIDKPWGSGWFQSRKRDSDISDQTR